jgi:hypothetical protein
MNCAQCGLEIPAGMRFCGGCGHPAQAATPPSDRVVADQEGDRRQLTVMFCDLVGSTLMSQNMDAEDLSDLLAAYQRVCAEAVQRYDGHIAQYLGDGVLIYFGYPRAHEDDARRAVLCGLEILQGLQELNAGITLLANAQLQARIGVHTGRVVVTSVGSGQRRESLAQGDTPNIAARVQSFAQPNAIVVSDTTWRLVRRQFSARSLGTQALKGITDDMLLWQVSEVAAYQHEDASSAFAGRKEELQQLRAAWAQALTGHSRFVLITGEAGIGKSRILTEFRQSLADAPFDLLDFRCSTYAQNSSFFPVIELLERRLGLERNVPTALRLDRLEQWLSELELISPENAALMVALLGIAGLERYPALEMSPARQRIQTLEILLSAVAALARKTPLLVMVEDLHWADPSTLELLQMVVQTPIGAPVLGLLTSRPGFRTDWHDGAALLTLELSHLPAADVEAVVKGIAGGKTVPAAVMRDIVKRCDGIPLFAEEVARAVLESGGLQELDNRWELTGNLPDGLIPASIDASLTARIDHLGEARATAQLAATIGREFSRAMLRLVSERPAELLDADLETLTRSGLAFRSGFGEREIFVFKHALVRDAAYESLLRRTRQQFHARLADAMRAHFPDDVAEQPELIAHHLVGAGQETQAIDYWETAGQRALSRSAMREASAHFKRAIESIGRLPASAEWQLRELDLQIMAAPVFMTVYGWGAADVHQCCSRAKELATIIGRYDKMYPPSWGIWTYFFIRGEMDKAHESAGVVRALAEASGVPMIRITGCHGTAYTHLYRAEFQQALREASEGLKLFDLEQERVLVSLFQLSSSAALLAVQATAWWMQGDPEAAAGARARMIELGRDIGSAPSWAAVLAWALHTGLCLEWTTEVMHDMAALADELMVLCRQEGYALWHAVGAAYRGALAVGLGEVESGLQLMREGLKDFTYTGARLTLVPMNVICAQAHLQVENYAEAGHLLDAAQHEADSRNERLWEPEIDRMRGRLLLCEDNAPAASLAFRRAIDKAHAQGAVALAHRAARDLAEVLQADGEPEAALALLAQYPARPSAKEAPAVARH